MSEVKVLHEWTSDGYLLRIVERDGVPVAEWDYETPPRRGWAVGVSADDLLIVAARLAARVRELEAMYESSHASRMHAESVVQRLEAESEALKAAVRTICERQMCGDPECSECEFLLSIPIVRSVIEKGGE